jgi:hypothetical protein
MGRPSDCVMGGMKMVMPQQFTLNWPFRMDKIADGSTAGS